MAIILLLATVLRFYKLSELPYPLNGDEKAFGYYAWSIAHFGTDEYGENFPLYFSSIGDYKYPVYTYLSVPLSYVFNLNKILPRFLSALSSIILILIIYRFCLLVLKSQKIALISSLLLAISPWSLTFSRTASESNLMTLLSFSGFYFLYKYLYKTQKKRDMIFSSLLLFLATFTYSAARIFIPLMIFIFLIYSIIQKNKDNFRKTFVIFTVALFVILVSLINPASRARANNISILSKTESRQDWINQSAYVLGLGKPTSPKITRIFFNKGTALFRDFIGRYLSHFSVDYLFLDGDIVKLNSIQNFGNFYIFEIIFFLIGLSLLIQKSFKKDIFSIFILFGILISPVAASGSIETPSAVRQLVGLPYFIICIAMGLNFLTQKSKVTTLIIVCLYIYFSSLLVLSIFKIKPYSQPWSTDQGNKELVNQIWQLKNKYKYIFVPNDPYIDFLFYQKITPKDFLSKAKIEKEEIGKWNRVSQYQNIIFNADLNCPKIGQKNALYVCNSEEISPFAHIVDVINYNDNVPHYLLIDFPGGNQTEQILPSRIKYILQKDMDKRWPDGIYTNPNQYYLDKFYEN